MSVLDPKANDFVAEKLGLLELVGLGRLRADEPIEDQVRFTAPNVLANPWLLIKALHQQNISVHFGANIVLLLRNRDCIIREVKIIDGDLARALLQAAFQMLSQENHGK